MTSFPIPSHHPHCTSIPPESNKAFLATAPRCRASILPPYTIAGQPVALSSIDITHDQAPSHDASFIPTVPPEIVHHYILRSPSRGRDSPFITVTSHAQNTQDPPLLYFGEELKGSVVLSPDDLCDMQSIDVVVSQFFPSGVIPIEPGTRSCRCSIVTLSLHRMRPSACCYPSTLIIPKSPAVNFAGPLLSRPLPLRFHPRANPL